MQGTGVAKRHATVQVGRQPPRSEYEKPLAGWLAVWLAVWLAGSGQLIESIHLPAGYNSHLPVGCTVRHAQPLGRAGPGACVFQVEKVGLIGGQAWWAGGVTRAAPGWGACTRYYRAGVQYGGLRAERDCSEHAAYTQRARRILAVSGCGPRPGYPAAQSSCCACGAVPRADVALAHETGDGKKDRGLTMVNIYGRGRCAARNGRGGLDARMGARAGGPVAAVSSLEYSTAGPRRAARVSKKGAEVGSGTRSRWGARAPRQSVSASRTPRAGTAGVCRPPPQSASPGASTWRWGRGRWPSRSRCRCRTARCRCRWSGWW
jgi:hypothetical protein